MICKQNDKYFNDELKIFLSVIRRIKRSYSNEEELNQQFGSLLRQKWFDKGWEKVIGRSSINDECKHPTIFPKRTS